MAEILMAVGLCKEISRIGLKLHNIAVNVSTNCEQQVTDLQTKAYGLSERVEHIGEMLKKDNTHQLKGLKEVLEDIKRVFNDLNKFITKLQRQHDRNLTVKLIMRTLKLSSVQKRIVDFDCALDTLEKRLNENVPEGILNVVLSLAQGQQNMQEVCSNLVRELANVTLTANLRERLKNKDFEKIMPRELTDEKVFLKTRNSTYSRAIFEGQKVVVKRVQADNQSKAGTFTREAQNLIMFSRGSIVRVFGMWDSEDEKFLVLEDMEKGTLSKVLEEEKELSLKNKFKLGMTAAQSLNRVHTKLVHTSLRTEKFLVDSKYTAKLSGMAYAVTFSSLKRYSPTGDLEDIYFYRPPERFKPCRLTKEADIYGFGIVLWEIFTQTKPFSSKLQGKDLNEANVRTFLEDKGEEYELNLQDPVNGDLSDLVRRCRSFDPKDRPDISDKFIITIRVIGVTMVFNTILIFAAYILL